MGLFSILSSFVMAAFWIVCVLFPLIYIFWKIEPVITVVVLVVAGILFLGKVLMIFDEVEKDLDEREKDE